MQTEVGSWLQFGNRMQATLVGKQLREQRFIGRINCAMQDLSEALAFRGKKQRQVRRSEHEDLLEAMADELKNLPEAMPIRAATVEHPFGTIKSWMGASHFLTRRLKNVRTEMCLHVLAYNIKRMISIKGVIPLMEAMRA